MPCCFTERVWELVRKIPEGRVTTYATIASVLGCRSPRAVGQALKRNPYSRRHLSLTDSRLVPCHRVIQADLRCGGFCGREIELKLRFLAEEGILFSGGRLVEKRRLLPPSYFEEEKKRGGCDTSYR